MSTAQIWQTTSSSLDNTLKIAGVIGSRLKGGEIIQLISDLGGGKTAFVRGMVAGMGSKDNVHSPSFTISNEYKAADLKLVHFDFYRLSEPGIMSQELAEIIDDPKAVVAVEWGDIVQEILPEKTITINIKACSENEREITFGFQQEYNYLFEGAKQ